MADLSETRDVPPRKTQNHQAQAEQRDAFIRQELQKRQIATAAKMAKLRAMRLARDGSANADSQTPPETGRPAKKSVTPRKRTGRAPSS